MVLPEDNFILLSYINTRLRNDCLTLEELCRELGVSAAYICERMAKIGYEYNDGQRAFK